MAAFDGIFKVNIGSESFQLSDYDYREEPMLEKGIGRIGTKVELKGEGWVEATTSSLFEAALGTTAAAFRVAGLDVFITGPNGVLELEILAAFCVEGGPQVGFEVLKQSDGVALVKNFRFTVTGQTNIDRSGSSVAFWKAKCDVRPDGLQAITFSGGIKGGAASDYFLGTVLANFQNAHGPSDYVNRYEYTDNVTDDDLTFAITFIELYQSLPNDGAGDVAVDGEYTTRVEIDEQQRQIVTFSYDLLLQTTSSVMGMMAYLRPTSPVLRESYEYTNYRENRLRCSFTIIEGVNGSNLLDWDHALDLPMEDQPVKAFEYANASPMLGIMAPPVYRVTQRGRAVCVNNYLLPPGPLFTQVGGSADASLAELPKIGFRPLNGIENETTWEYVFLFVSGPPQMTAALMAQLARPTNPAFLT